MVKMTHDISALMDGELADNEAGRLLMRLKNDEDSRDAWMTYHLIGDVLRRDGAAPRGLETRIFAKLADEPTVLAPRRAPLLSNVPKFAFAAAASVVTVAAVGWLALQSPGEKPVAPIASKIAPASSPAAEPATVVAADYLRAHQDFAPAPVGFRQVGLEDVSGDR
jgi:sigma-E factor negative regulatory protein RseA